MDEPAIVLVSTTQLNADNHRVLTEVAASSPQVWSCSLTGPGLTITCCLDEVSAAGHTSIVLLIPAQDACRSTQAWVHRVARHWVGAHPEFSGQIHVATDLLQSQSLRASVDALLRHTGDAVRRCSRPAPASRDAADNSAARGSVDSEGSAEIRLEPLAATPPLLSPAWEEVPAFRRHVLLCRGPRCSAMGSAETAAVFVEAGLDDDHTLLTNTGCLYPCSRGPVIAVYPDDVWYGGVDRDCAQQIVQQHLLEGRPLDEHRIRDHGQCFPPDSSPEESPTGREDPQA